MKRVMIKNLLEKSIVNVAKEIQNNEAGIKGSVF